MEKEEEFYTWVKQGIDNGWITEPFCTTHDGDPYMSEEDEAEWEAGGDPCSHVFKIRI